jgi:hypothetical protein
VAAKEKEVLDALGLNIDATEDERNARLNAALIIREEAKEKGLTSDDVRTAGKIARDGNVKYAFGSISDKREGSSFDDFEKLRGMIGLGGFAAKKHIKGAANILDKVSTGEIDKELFQSIDFNNKEKMAELKKNIDLAQRADNKLKDVMHKRTAETVNIQEKISEQEEIIRKSELNINNLDSDSITSGMYDNAKRINRRSPTASDKKRKVE